MNVDNQKFSEQVLTSILKNKEWPDNDESYKKVEKMTAFEAMDAFLAWHGFIGYTEMIMNANAAVLEAASEDPGT